MYNTRTNTGSFTRIFGAGKTKSGKAGDLWVNRNILSILTKMVDAAEDHGQKGIPVIFKEKVNVAQDDNYPFSFSVATDRLEQIGLSQDDLKLT